jgi:hypothetical protein
VATHENLGAEARALLDVLSHRLEQAAQPASAAELHDGTRCTSCPICAALAYLKEHRELSTQLAQGALLIVTALRQYLDNSATGTGPASKPASTAVQHIVIN